MRAVKGDKCGFILPYLPTSFPCLVCVCNSVLNKSCMHCYSSSADFKFCGLEGEKREINKKLEQTNLAPRLLCN
jgi:hypothetical protein